jgi:hypothetical protein
VGAANYGAAAAIYNFQEPREGRSLKACRGPNAAVIESVFAADAIAAGAQRTTTRRW